jgi:RND superfamily putative drug exporter
MLDQLTKSATPVVSPDDPEHDEAWLARLARFSGRHRRGVLAVWLVAVLALAPLALTLTHSLSGAGWEAQGSTAQHVRDELRRDFPQANAEAAVVVYHQATPIAADPAGLQTLITSLHGAPGSSSVVNPLTLPRSAGLVSPDGRTAMVPVGLQAVRDAQRPESAKKLIDHVRNVALPPGAQAKVTGEWAVWSDFNASNEHALHLAEVVSGVPTIILLLVAFGSALAAGIPLLLAIAGIAVGFGALNLLTHVTPLSVWAMNSR